MPAAQSSHVAAASSLNLPGWQAEHAVAASSEEKKPALHLPQATEPEESANVPGWHSEQVSRSNVSPSRYCPAEHAAHKLSPVVVHNADTRVPLPQLEQGIQEVDATAAENDPALQLVHGVAAS